MQKTKTLNNKIKISVWNWNLYFMCRGRRLKSAHLNKKGIEKHKKLEYNISQNVKKGDLYVWEIRNSWKEIWGAYKIN